MAEKAQGPTEPPVTQNDLRYVQQRVENLSRQIRILIDMLVNNKTITAELAKVFTETKDDKANEEVLKWFLDKNRKPN